MRVFLASIPLEGRKVVVVGGGEPGAAKARLIARTPAELVWYAPDAVPPEAERPAGLSPCPAGRRPASSTARSSSSWPCSTRPRR